MASFHMDGIDALINDMRKLGDNIVPVSEALVTAGAAEIRDCWRESAEKHGLRDTGAMIESVGFPDPPVTMGDVVYRDIYPVGKDGKGTRNAEKAFILHYGRAGRRAIEPTYWVDDAEDAAALRVPLVLEKLWGEYLETGKVPSIPDAGESSGGITKVTK